MPVGRLGDDARGASAGSTASRPEQRGELAALGDAVDRDHAPRLADGAQDRHQPDRPAADDDDRAARARRRRAATAP